MAFPSDIKSCPLASRPSRGARTRWRSSRSCPRARNRGELDPRPRLSHTGSPSTSAPGGSPDLWCRAAPRRRAPCWRSPQQVLQRLEVVLVRAVREVEARHGHARLQQVLEVLHGPGRGASVRMMCVFLGARRHIGGSITDAKSEVSTVGVLMSMVNSGELGPGSGAGSPARVFAAAQHARRGRGAPGLTWESGDSGARRLLRAKSGRDGSPSFAPPAPRAAQPRLRERRERARSYRGREPSPVRTRRRCRARWCEAAASWTSIRRGEPHISRDSIPFSETRDWMHCRLGTPDEDLARRDAFSAKSLKRATRRIKDSQMCWARSL